MLVRSLQSVSFYHLLEVLEPSIHLSAAVCGADAAVVVCICRISVVYVQRLTTCVTYAVDGDISVES